MMSNVLELKNVRKEYSDFTLDNISFSIPEGCICGFIGQNGAGKTTTIQLILDSIRRTAGEISVFGRDITKEGYVVKEDIGVVFDEMGFHDFMTPIQINRMMKQIYKNWDEEVFYEYLKRFSLPRNKKCGSYSRGMRMKLQIATAMSHHAKLLLMDEPTSGLDPIVRNEILQIFQEFVMEENHTVLLSSHITGDIERIADMVVFIDHGKIVLQGIKDEIMENHGLIRCKKSQAETFANDENCLIRQTAFGAEVLLKDKENGCKKYSDMTIEQPTLEEIMIFYVNENFAKESKQ